MSLAAERLHHVRTYDELEGKITTRSNCPKCGNDALVQLLKSMRRHSVTEDWFRCDKCDHLFTRPRSI